VPIIQAIQQHTQIIRQIELKKALNGLKNGHSPEQLLEQLSWQLTQKLSHNTLCLVQQLAADSTINDVSLIPLKKGYTST
jgi:glutamyl-tRNA reductase